MRAPLGWIIYTGPCREQTCISKPSETLQGWTKCDYRQLNCKNKLWLPEVQNSTLLLHFFDESELETCDVTWMKTHALKKLSFLMFSCFLAAHSASVSSHQQLELLDLELLHVGHVLFCFLFFLCVFTSCSSGHSLRLQKCGTVSDLAGDRSVLHTHLESDSVSPCQSNFTQHFLFTGVPLCWVS